MNGHEARKRREQHRRRGIEAHEVTGSVMQHMHDRRYFEDHPGVRWRVRAVVDGEVPGAPLVTHMLVVYVREFDQWTARPLAADSDGEAWAAGALAFVQRFGDDA